jgi:FkbM family methyltransferase
MAIASREGVLAAWRLNAMTKSPPGEIAELRFSNLRHPIFARVGTPDIATIVNTIVREEYGAFEPESPPTFMIDAGAYIGDSSAYFASKFQRLSIVALEPHPDNLALARRNLAPYGERVTLLNQALAATSRPVRIAGEHDGAAISAQGMAVEATTAPMIMTLAGQSRVDILKMDIEGFEGEVLAETADEWLSQVGLLIVECHGKDIESKVMETLKRNGFEARRHRSLWYCRPRVAT